MKLIAGLGNPGKEYEHTPHNVGYETVDSLCGRLNGEWKSQAKFEGRVARVTSGGEPLLLVQPLTFMNASGQCVGELMRYYRLQPADVIAISDDADLPVGRMRIRSEGGNGGHRGLASLIDHLGTNAFPRIRIGIGRGPNREEGLTGYVLGRFPAAARASVDKTIAAAADAALLVVRDGVNAAMNQFNGFNAAGDGDSAQSPEGSSDSE